MMGEPLSTLGLMRYSWFFILSFAAAVFLSSGCMGRALVRPNVTLGSVEVTGLSLTGAHLTLQVDLENPNRFGVTITRLGYTVFLNDRPLATGAVLDPISIPSRATTTVRLPLSTSFRDLKTGLKSLLESDSVAYAIEGDVAIRSFFGSRNFPYHRTGTINLKRHRPPESGGSGGAPRSGLGTPSGEVFLKPRLVLGPELDPATRISDHPLRAEKHHQHHRRAKDEHPVA